MDYAKSTLLSKLVASSKIQNNKSLQVKQLDNRVRDRFYEINIVLIESLTHRHE